MHRRQRGKKRKRLNIFYIELGKIYFLFVESFSLDTRVTGSFSFFDRLLVGLWTRLAHAAEQRGNLERSLQVAGGGLTEKMDLDFVVFQGALHRRDGLHEQWVGVVQVQMHEPHHGQTGIDRLDSTVNFLQIIVLDSGDF